MDNLEILYLHFCYFLDFEDDEEVRKLIVQVEKEDRGFFLPLPWLTAVNKRTPQYVVIEDYKSFLETI